VLATWLIAMPIYALFPVAPPRLAGVGLVDTITQGGGVRLDSALTTAFYNPLAAVPSLHAGFALAVGVALAAASRRRWLKLLALSWAPIISLAVVATGNHFLFDIAAGVLVTVTGYVTGNAVDRHFAGRRPGRRTESFGGALPAAG
jgi:membrane-associated phospholipid phosphatase